MRKDQVREPADALVYLLDCTLATVCDMAMKRSRSVYDFNRQKSIAQTALNWAVEFKADLTGSRAEEALRLGGVNEWADQFDCKNKDSA